MNDVKAERVADWDALSAPGRFMFAGNPGDQPTDLIFVCPCGCGVISSVTLSTSPRSDGPRWAWNGNSDSPTLTPSIRKLNGCLWHGFLTDGIFKSC